MGSNGDGEGTYAYQERGELESRRIEKTSWCLTQHTHPWGRVQCTMGEDGFQPGEDEPESK